LKYGNHYSHAGKVTHRRSQEEFASFAYFVVGNSDQSVKSVVLEFNCQQSIVNCQFMPVDLVTEKGLLPFARESADHDKILIYERAA